MTDDGLNDAVSDCVLAMSECLTEEALRAELQKFREVGQPDEQNEHVKEALGAIDRAFNDWNLINVANAVATIAAIMA